jgi:hypothetical protein
MSVSGISRSNAALQSLTHVQHTGRCGHGNDNDADDGASVSRTGAPAEGGLLVSLLQSLQQVLSVQAPAATNTTPTDAASAVTNSSTIAATTAKDLGNFLHTLFQALRTTSSTAASAATAPAADASSSTTDPAAVVASTAAAATSSVAAMASDGDHDSRAAGVARGHRGHGLAAYRNNLVSGLQSILQQLQSGSTDASGSSTGALKQLTGAFQTLIQDLSGAQGAAATSSGGATSTAALQSFLTELIGSLQSSGSSAQALSGNVVSATA